MSFVHGTFSMTCNSCGVQIDFESDEADFEATGGDPDRQMGAEYGYTWENTFNCECESEIEVDYSVYEYPEGTFNHDEVRISGATEIGRFSYDFHSDFSDEFDSEEFE